jgi:hypothetical protein
LLIGGRLNQSAFLLGFTNLFLMIDNNGRRSVLHSVPAPLQLIVETLGRQVQRKGSSVSALRLFGVTDHLQAAAVDASHHHWLGWLHAGGGVLVLIVVVVGD